jgi:hypothetical protein
MQAFVISRRIAWKLALAIAASAPVIDRPCSMAEEEQDARPRRSQPRIRIAAEIASPLRATEENYPSRKALKYRETGKSPALSASPASMRDALPRDARVA